MVGWPWLNQLRLTALGRGCKGSLLSALATNNSQVTRCAPEWEVGCTSNPSSKSEHQIKSLTTSPAKISPATDGTKDILDGVWRLLEDSN